MSSILLRKMILETGMSVSGVERSVEQIEWEVLRAKAGIADTKRQINKLWGYLAQDEQKLIKLLSELEMNDVK